MKTLKKKSPFAIFDQDEKLTRVESQMRISMYITDLDRAILLAVNDTLVSTSSLLFKRLQSREDVINQTTIKQRLNKLWKAEFIDKYQYINEDGSYSASKTYTLGYRGRGLVKSIGIKPNKTSYLQEILENEPQQIKRLLSAQQFAVYFGANKFKVGETVFVPNMRGNAKKIFRPHATVTSSDGQTLFIESVRNATGEFDRLISKLHRISEVLKHASKANIQLSGTVSVILVCEDIMHMNNLTEQLRHSKLKLCFNLQITNDLDIYIGMGKQQFTSVPTMTKNHFWLLTKRAS